MHINLASVAELQTELLGRPDFSGVIITVDAIAEAAAPQRGRIFQTLHSASLDRPQLAHLLMQASDRIEGGQ